LSERQIPKEGRVRAPGGPVDGVQGGGAGGPVRRRPHGEVGVEGAVPPVGGHPRDRWTDVQWRRETSHVTTAIMFSNTLSSSLCRRCHLVGRGHRILYIPYICITQQPHKSYLRISILLVLIVLYT